jgi:TonB family protein
MISLLSKFLRLTIAVLVSFLLFASIPLIRGLLGYSHPQKPVMQQRRIIAEIVRTPPKKEITHISPARPVTNALPGQAGTSDKNGLSFKITPDLAVEGPDGAEIAGAGQDMTALTFDESRVDENVIPLSMPQVNYPQRAREIGIQGTLEVLITIDRDGSVLKVDVIKSPHQSITEEAQKKIMMWKFKPAKIKGIPVKVKRIQDIEFKLDS